MDGEEEGESPLNEGADPILLKEQILLNGTVLYYWALRNALVPSMEEVPTRDFVGYAIYCAVIGVQHAWRWWQRGTL